MTRTAGDQTSQSDRERNRAEMRDSLPAVALLVAAQGVLLVLEPGRRADAGNLVWAFLSLLGLLGLVWAQQRSLRRADEYQRIVKLEAMAVGFAVFVVLAFGAGLLDGMGYGNPRQSFQITSIAGVLAWTAALAVKTRRAR